MAVETVKNIGVKLDKEHLNMLNELKDKFGNPVDKATTSSVVKYAIKTLYEREMGGKQ